MDTSTDRTGLSALRDLRRSSTDRIVAGVAGGLAHRFGISTAAVRTLFVIGGLLGIGLAWYAALVLGTRRDDDPRPVTPAALVGSGVLVVLGVVVPVVAWLSAAIRVPLVTASSGFVAVLFATVGGILLLGRRQPVQAAVPSSPSVVTVTHSRDAIEPPALLLVTAAVGGLAAAGVWAAARQLNHLDAFGAILATLVVVCGLGQALGAWRGRSYTLAPIGVIVAIPLALAAMANARLDLGSDNPGRLSANDGAAQAYVLGRGSQPVVVPRAAVDGGLQSLTVRKLAGTIELQIDPGIPASIEVRTLTEKAAISNTVGPFVLARRVIPQTVAFPAEPGTASQRSLRVVLESAFGNVAVLRTPASLPGPAVAQLDAARQDLAARKRLLNQELAARSTLQRKFAAAVAAIPELGALPEQVAPSILTVREERWPGMSVDDNFLRDRDLALAKLTQSAKRIQAAQKLRFDLLRVEWRINAVQRGIRTTKARINKLAKEVGP